MQKKLCKCTLALAIAATFAGAARADAILDLTPPTLDTAAGGTVEFAGTLTNTGDADLYLNGDVVILPYPDLTVDDSPFFNNSPLFLSPGDGYTGPFIDVTVDPATPSGSYSGSYTIQGGTDPNAFDNLATAGFTVNVGEVTATPEPNTTLLIASGLAALAGGLRKRRKIGA
ncbi:MAG: PEP-CTERM sorting domain-containing protein [Terracidiphilus sp.]|jgi:hypothetical protein